MNFVNMDYTQLILEILDSGYRHKTRNAVRTRIKTKSIAFSQTPLITLRKTAWKNCIREWEWFMSGSSHIDDLAEPVQHWWTPYQDVHGEINYNYGHQFRYYGMDPNNPDAIDMGFDQIKWLVQAIQAHPESTRNIITTWHTEQMQRPDCPITNCHGTVIQAFVENGELSISTYQRSCDVICGVPHNWLQYWAFLMWLASQTNLRVGNLIWIGGDVHIYEEHEELARKIIQTYQSRTTPDVPELVYAPNSPEFKAGDFSLNGTYKWLLGDKAKMIV